MYDLIIIGAGPGGIALAAEACASGINQSQILVLEKGATHNSAIRQLYPDQKLTTANYKGFDARCEGLLCLSDMTKSETIEFFDKVIADYRINIQFNAEVFGMQGLNQEGGSRFRVESSNGTYESRVLAVAIGIFGRPNKPKEYRLLPSLKERLLFDMTSQPIQNEEVLVVGGGDTAAEYVQYLHAQLNRVSLSYRQAQFTRLSKQNHDALFAMEERNEVEILVRYHFAVSARACHAQRCSPLAVRLLPDTLNPDASIDVRTTGDKQLHDCPNVLDCSPESKRFRRRDLSGRCLRLGPGATRQSPRVRHATP